MTAGTETALPPTLAYRGGSARPPVDLTEIIQKVKPAALSQQRLLPVSEQLLPLLPEPGLRRGSVLTVGSPRLAMQLVAEASQAGSWCGVVGMPSFGALAASEAGMVLSRVAVIGDAGSHWATVVAALLEAFDIVIVSAPRHVSTSDERRLLARAKDRGSVLISLTPSWPHAPHVTIDTLSGSWFGVGNGHGHLSSRRIQVCVSGRGSAARPKRAWVWFSENEQSLSVEPITPAVHSVASQE